MRLLIVSTTMRCLTPESIATTERDGSSYRGASRLALRGMRTTELHNLLFFLLIDCSCSSSFYGREGGLRDAGRPSAVRAQVRAPVRMLRFDDWGGCTPKGLPLRLEKTVTNLLRSKLNTAETGFLIRGLCSDYFEQYAL